MTAKLTIGPNVMVGQQLGGVVPTLPTPTDGVATATFNGTAVGGIADGDIFDRQYSFWPLDLWAVSGNIGAAVADVQVPVTTSGAGKVYMRTRNAGTSRVHMDWTLIDTVPGPGAHILTLALPAAKKAQEIDIAQGDGSHLTANHYAVTSFTFALLGQSQEHRFVEKNISKVAGGVINPPTNDAYLMQVALRRVISSPAGEAILNITNTNYETPALAAMKNALEKSTGGYPCQYISISEGATGLQNMIDASDTIRDFLEDEKVWDLATWNKLKHPSLVITWWDTRTSSFEHNWADIFCIFHTEMDSSGTPFTRGDTYPGYSFQFDYFGTDLWDPTKTRMVAGQGHRYEAFSSGGDTNWYSAEAANKTNVNSNAREYRNARMSIGTLKNLQSGALANKFVPELMPGLFIHRYSDATSPTPWADRAHPGTWDNGNGLNLAAGQVAHMACRAQGITNWTVPELDNILWTNAYVEVWTSAGPVTTWALENGVSVPTGLGAHWTEVLGFEIDQRPAQRVEIVNGRIRIYPDGICTQFTGNNRLRFMMGGGAGVMVATNDEDISNLPWRFFPCVDMGLEGDYDGAGAMPNLVTVMAPDEFIAFWDNQLPLTSAQGEIEIADNGTYWIDNGYEEHNNGGARYGSQITFEAEVMLPTGLTDGSSRQLFGIDSGTSIEVTLRLRANSGAMQFRAQDTASYDSGLTSCGSLTKDTWHKVRMVIDFSDTADGYIGVWLDDVQVGARTGLATNGQISSNSKFFSFNSSAGLGSPAGLTGLQFRYFKAWKTAEADRSAPTSAPYYAVGHGALAANENYGHIGADAVSA